MAPRRRTRFAEGTSVPSERTRAELDRLLMTHGATQRSIGEDEEGGRCVVVFKMQGRHVRLQFGFDGPKSPERGSEPKGWGSWATDRRKDWIQRQHEQGQREAWRRLLLVTKAKLELVTDGGSTVEREFLADIMLSDGSTVIELIAPRIAEAYQTGTMPALLPGPSTPKKGSSTK